MENQENSRLTQENMGKFVMIPHSFIQDAKDKKLSLHARWLFVALRYYTNGRSGVAFPSYSTINKLTGLRREKISSSLKELEKAGWVTREPRFGNSSLYTLTIPQAGVPDSPSEISEPADSVSEISEGAVPGGAVRVMSFGGDGVSFGEFDPDLLRNAVEVVEIGPDDPEFFEGLEPLIDYLASTGRV